MNQRDYAADLGALGYQVRHAAVDVILQFAIQVAVQPSEPEPEPINKHFSRRRPGGACELMHLCNPTLASTPGGAQSQLLRASDGNSYVTKFQNNPQDIRALANEMLATRLGLALGLPMPRVEVIEVSDWLIEHTEDLRMMLAVREFGAKRQAIGIALRGLPRHDAGLLATGISYGGLATWQTSPERSSWTSGFATPMGGRQSMFAKRCGAGDIPLHSSIKATASTPASGHSLNIY